MYVGCPPPHSCNTSLRFRKELSRKSTSFPIVFHIAAQQSLKPLWSRLLLHDHEPSRASFALCFMSLRMSLLSQQKVIYQRGTVFTVYSFTAYIHCYWKIRFIPSSPIQFQNFRMSWNTKVIIRQSSPLRE